MDYFPAIETVLLPNPVAYIVSYLKDFLSWAKQIILQILGYFWNSIIIMAEILQNSSTSCIPLGKDISSQITL